jgi:alkylation response protein AidB-like acyl-CoA dehydrogenase
MNLNLTPDQLRFRDEVRAFVKAELPSDMRESPRAGGYALPEHVRGWQRILHARGWGAPSWPVEFGGTGWSRVEQYLFEIECVMGGAPAQLPFGLKMVAPVLMRYGSRDQQDRFLPRILSGEDWWCQGYSEPSAGSDLASLKTQAVREGDYYVVNGQKAWNTLGQHADWIFCLVRTDSTVKPQRGISFLLIDMKSPGVTVKPTTLLDGTQEVNEIWFENVRVPVANRIGEENEGWTYAKYLLRHERTNLAGVGHSRRDLSRLKNIAATVVRDGQPLLANPSFRRRVAQVDIELGALEVTTLRVICAAEKGDPGAATSILKVKGTEVHQAISELLVEAVGIDALPFASHNGDPNTLPGRPYAAGVTAEYLNLRKISIYGGSNEIQKNIIAQTILGL